MSLTASTDRLCGVWPDTSARSPPSSGTDHAADQPTGVVRLVQGEHAPDAVVVEVLDVEAAQAERDPTTEASDAAGSQVSVGVWRSEVIATGADPPLRSTVDLVHLNGRAVVPVVYRKRVSEGYAPPGQKRPGEAEIHCGGGRACAEVPKVHHATDHDVWSGVARSGPGRSRLTT